jgi:predicted ATPase
MKRKLVVKNFANIKEAVYEPKKFNVIIGEQATGKSLLVKLDYFFNEVIEFIFTPGFLLDDIKIEYIKSIFFEYFNEDILNNFEFEITYFFKTYSIKLLKKTNPDLNIEFNSDLLNFLHDIQKNTAKRGHNDLIDILNTIKRIDSNQLQLTFIPAGRSYFSNIDKNIFFMLEQNARIDKFLIKFGSSYETLKGSIPKVEQKFILSRVEEVLKGKIELDNNNKIGIKSNYFTELFYASSGQQESLPMLLVLLDAISSKNSKNIYVEEPEAHLYPKSQKSILEILSYLYNLGNTITITTHSPYIITAINNLLLANEVKDKLDTSNLLALKNFAIDSSDIGVYAIEDGVLKSSFDDENGLINAYTIDKISDEFSQTFNQLLDLEE